jgi:hypothetical protein
LGVGVAKLAAEEFGVDEAGAVGREVGEELVEAVVRDLDDVGAVEVGGEELLFTHGAGNAGAFEDDLRFGAGCSGRGVVFPLPQAMRASSGSSERLWTKMRSFMVPPGYVLAQLSPSSS